MTFTKLLSHKTSTKLSDISSTLPPFTTKLQSILQTNLYFPKTFEPLDLGPHIGKLPNRIIMGSMHSGLEGYSFPQVINKMMNINLQKMATYFEKRAQGGCGLMVTGGISPNKSGWVSPFAAKLDASFEMEMHKLVTDKVHNVYVPTYDMSNNKNEKGRICLQILHAGRYAAHPFAVSSSNTKSPISPFKAKELSLNNVQSTIKDFVNCAVLAKEANYDGVEIMGSEGYLINQFLVSETNKRRDIYGGSFENRMRFAVDIVRQTRQAVGNDFIVIFRLSMLDLIENGSTWEEVKLLAQAIENAGATIINTGIGWHQARVPTIATSVPRGGFAWVTKKLKEENVVNIPICTANRINDPKVVERILDNDNADLISMARPFLADPNIVQKSRNGDYDTINTCIGCNQACLDHVFMGKVASCLVNPEACHETEISVIPDSVLEKDRLNIGVIGSGPSGLAFSITAAKIGHTVTLYEKLHEIGGQFNMAKRIPGKEEFHESLRYFKNQLETLEKNGKLTVCLNTNVTLSDMKENKDIDKWIHATGVNPRIPSIQGIDHPNVLSYIDVLREKVHVGKKVAIIGAGGIGFDVAEYLLHYENKDKTVDDMDIDEFLDDWGVDKNILSRGGLLPKESKKKIYKSKREIIMMQRKKGKLGKNLGKTTGWVHRSNLMKSNTVVMIDNVQYDKVDDNGNLHISFGKERKDKKILDVNNIILCSGQISNTSIEDEADYDFSTKIYSIGGAYEALELDAKRAIDMGTRLALKIADKSVIPGKHNFEPGPSTGQKIYQLINKFK